MCRYGAACKWGRVIRNIIFILNPNPTSLSFYESLTNLKLSIIDMINLIVDYSVDYSLLFFSIFIFIFILSLFCFLFYFLLHV